MDSGDQRLSRARRGVAAVVVIAEALALSATGVGYMVYAFRDAAAARGMALGLAAFALVVAVALVAAARGLWRQRRWARSLVVTWQVMQFAVALMIWPYWTAIAVALAAMATLAAVLTLVDAFRAGHTPSDETPAS